MATEDLSSVLRLFCDPFTARLVARQAQAIQDVARVTTGGCVCARAATVFDARSAPPTSVSTATR